VTIGAVGNGGLLLIGGILVLLAASVGAPTSCGQASQGESRKDPERIEIAGIENAFRLSPRLYSGGDPHGVEAFSALKKLGIRTIISVDGSTPDVETARALGLRYVHLPIGYDGVPRAQAVKLVQAVKALPGPVYVHCHHGKHRGPAAAAVCGIATEGWSKDEAIRWMERAGTATDYAGLYTSAREFVAPTAEELERVGDELPERAKVPALVEMMVQVDGRWDHMKAVQKAGFRAPRDQPDIDPPHEALQLVELFRELARLPEAKERGGEFLAALELAERNARDLEGALRLLAKGPAADAQKRAEAAFLAAGASCTSCHAGHRDR
jgi:protein tyrosine phosphatase (PTP) superfamily phosphohydrolase (DUF442 family)